jgi:hypothetical protein
MGEYNDEYYYQKYLKYKNKYLELKQYEGGGMLSGMLPETGIYAYFCNKTQADRICSDPKFGKTTTAYNINKILSENKNFIAYKGKHGDTKLTRIRQYTTVKATNATTSAARYAGTATTDAARYVGTVATSAGTAVGSAATSAGTAVGTAATSARTAVGTAATSARTAVGTAATSARTAVGTAAIDARTAAMNRGSDFASGVATRAGKLGESASKSVDAAIKRVTPKQRDLFIGGGKPVILNLFDQTTKAKKVLDYTDEEYLLNIVQLLRRQPGDAHKTIDSVVIITYSPMGKNICNKKITFTTNQLVMTKPVVEALLGLYEQVTAEEESPQEIVLGKKIVDQGQALIARSKANIAAKAAAKGRPLLKGPNYNYQGTDSESDERQDEL